MKKIILILILLGTLLVANTNLKVLVNQKHTEAINLLTKTDKHVITYSKKEAILKVWDRKSDRLLKEFRNIDLNKMGIVGENLSYIGEHEFGNINLKDFTIFQDKHSTINYEKIIITNNEVFIGCGYMGGFGGYINIYNKKIHKEKNIKIHDCHACGLPDFELSINQEYIYLNPNDNCSYKISKKDSEFDMGGECVSALPNDLYKNRKIIEIKNRINDGVTSYVNKFSYKYKKEFKQNHPNGNLITIADSKYDEDSNLYLLNKNNKTKMKLTPTAYTGGNTIGTMFEQPHIYTTNKNRIIALKTGAERHGDDTERSGTYYVFNEKGKLLREIAQMNSSINFEKINDNTIKVYADKNYIVWDKSIEILDENFQTIQTVENSISNDVVYIEREDDKVTIYYKNNTIQYYKLSNAKLLATKYIIDNDTEITLTHQGFFSGKGGYRDYVHLVDNRQNIYYIDQFFKSFYRPDLVRLALNGVAIKSVIALEDVVSTKKSPRVSFLDNRSERINIDDDHIDLSICLRDNGGGIGRIRVYLNNTMISTSDRTVMRRSKRCDKVYKVDIALQDGKNEIKVLAWNSQETMQTKPIKLTVNADIKKTAPNLYGLIVGIEKFENEELNLKYSVADAKLIKDTINSKSTALFKKIDLKYLSLESETTKERILESFEEIRKKIKPSDYFIFYVASHGMVENSNFYLLTSNVNFLDDINDSAISDNQLISLIGNIPTPNKIVILDTCYAGQGGGNIAKAMLSKEITATRGLSNKDAIDLLKIESGASIFSASASDQQAIEGYKNHGLFTYFLAKGLDGDADSNSDGYVDLSELRKYVKQNVYKVSKERFEKAQRPYIPKVTDIPFSKVK